MGLFHVVSYLGASIRIQAITYKKGDSLCIAIKALKESGIHSICLPDKAKAFILKIYNSIGIIAKFAEKAKTPKISSIITIKVNQQTNLGNIYVSQTGRRH